MDTEDSLKFHVSSNPGGGNLLRDDPCETVYEPTEVDLVSLRSEVREEVILDDPVNLSDGYLETSKIVLENKVENVGTASLNGVKRSRVTVEEQLPSVFVVYKSLNKDSKQKLEELLHQWSQWHALNCSSSEDLNDILESGEETYFPALRINLDKPSGVSFWVDNQIKNQTNKQLISVDDASIPLYDRGFSSALTSSDVSTNLNGGAEDLDTSRCFNCGSYSHALKDCAKPRDNVAVNNARKQHRSKRIQHTSSQRYYQSSRGGKYDGLMPGVLDSKTRQLLGLTEFDPPPWLNRMREIGYPPGYLGTSIDFVCPPVEILTSASSATEPDEKDQPSGITIFGDEVLEEETEDGEIVGASYTKPSKKMSVEFPGVNAPIPEEADERLWAPSYSSFNPSGARSPPRHKQSSEDFSRGYNHSRGRCDFEDDDGPPGCEPGTSPSLSNNSRRYGYPDSSYSSISPYASPRNRSSTLDISMSDRNRRSPYRREDASRRSFPYSYPR